MLGEPEKKTTGFLRLSFLCLRLMYTPLISVNMSVCRIVTCTIYSTCISCLSFFVIRNNSYIVIFVLFNLCFNIIRCFLGSSHLFVFYIRRISRVCSKINGIVSGTYYFRRQRRNISVSTRSYTFFLRITGFLTIITTRGITIKIQLTGSVQITPQ